MAPPLSAAQRTFLLQTGREAMEAAVRAVPPPARPTTDPRLRQPCGAFATLTISGELRGCVGYPEPLHPLVEAVARSSVKAALADHRFDPVVPDELRLIRLELSVLSSRVPIGSVAEIEVGRDGLCLEQGNVTGLLLPQVAVEQGWNAETFLRMLFRKCDLPPLPPGTPGLSLYRFTAEHFSGDPPPSGISG